MQLKRTIFVGLNIAGVILALVVNALANILPINGKNTGQLSDQYPNLFVPAGITFAIWGVIYLLLIVFSVYQIVILFRIKGVEQTAVEKMGILFFISACANAGWIFAWHYENLLLSIVVMLVLLATLIAIYVRLGIGKADASAGERVCIHSTISVYLGWISIATIANAAALLVSIKWDRFGLPEQFWTVLVIAAGVALALLSLFSRKDVLYALVVDWALVGILIKRLANDPASVPGIIIAVIAGISIISIGVPVQIARRKTYY